MNFPKTVLVTAVILTLVSTTLIVPKAAAAQRLVVIRPYPLYAPVWGPGWYYRPYYSPWRQVYVSPYRGGDVKIQTHLKDASIYIDGGYAGVTGKLKQFSIQPGNHDVEIRDFAGHALFHERIQVLADKTVEIKL